MVHDDGVLFGYGDQMDRELGIGCPPAPKRGVVAEGK